VEGSIPSRPVMKQCDIKDMEKMIRKFDREKDIEDSITGERDRQEYGSRAWFKFNDKLNRFFKHVKRL